MIADRSISLRLTIWFSSVLLAGLALFGVLMWLDLKQTLTSTRNRTLERRVERLEDLLHDTEPVSPAQRTRSYEAFADATGGGLIEVFRADGSRALPSPTPAAQTFPWPTVTQADGDRFTEVMFQGQPYRVLAHSFVQGSATLVLCVASPLESSRTILRSYSGGLLWAIPAVLLISGLGGYILSRRALMPVDRITAAAQSISVSNLSARLPVPATRDELRRLTETHNAMLARLESAMNEINRFTSDASHELRTPVSFVRTAAELGLRNQEIDPGSRRAFEEIVAECGKISRLLKDMLTLARADAVDPRLAFEPVQLQEVSKAVCAKARALAEERGHTLTHSEGDGAATVWGDYATLQRLLWILVDNASKYTPAPGRIDVALSAAEGGVTMTVTDNGIGIAADDLPHIFGRFYRADRSRSNVEGFGLGLSIAKWIADIHQATLSVQSRENEGSVFTIVFPAYSADSAAESASVGDAIHSIDN